MKYSDFAEELSQQFIEIVEGGRAPWQEDFKFFPEPMSYQSGNPYNGGNAMKLMISSVVQGFDDPRWVTRRQAEDLGGSVIGKPTRIFFFSDKKTVKEKDADSGESIERTVLLDRPTMRSYHVWNIEQVEGMESVTPLEIKNLGWKQADLLENIKGLTQIDLNHNSKPAYYPGEDKIGMPPPESYTDEKRYAAHLLHEITHWTGHKQRLNRPGITENHFFGTKEYAREEVVAQLGMLLTTQKTGIEIQNFQDESYINGWWTQAKELLEESPNEIMKICRDAYAARDYIMEGKELDRIKESSVEHKVELSDFEKVRGRINLDVPFSEKNNAKALARMIDVDLKWDRKEKTWFANVEDGQNIGNLAKFRVDSGSDEKKQTPEVDKTAMKKTYYQIPYQLKDSAKQEAKDAGLELKWDKKEKSWYALTPESGDSKRFEKWLNAQSKPVAKGKRKESSEGLGESVKMGMPGESGRVAKENEERQRVYLNVPFEKKEGLKKQAREANADLKWDSDFKAWYGYKESLTAEMKSFVPETSSAALVENGTMDRFSDAMQAAGAIGVTGSPIFDGKFHRVKDANDSAGEKSISYKAFNNGVPNAVIVNHKTGEKTKWIDSAKPLNEEQKKAIRVANKNAEEHARAEGIKLRNAAAKMAKQVVNSSAPVESHPYLKAKGIQAHGLRVSRKDELVIPLRNTLGEIRTIQKIKPDGTKRYLSGGEKEGNFHMLGKIVNGEPIIVTEGFATAATISEITGYPVVAAMDSNNLLPVAKSLQKAYPDSVQIFASDNDFRNKNGNVGLKKAEAAAEAVKGELAVPEIASHETNQTDFNDVARVHGKAAVFRQLKPALNVARSRTDFVKARAEQPAPSKREEKPAPKIQNQGR